MTYEGRCKKFDVIFFVLRIKETYICTPFENQGNIIQSKSLDREDIKL